MQDNRLTFDAAEGRNVFRGIRIWHRKCHAVSEAEFVAMRKARDAGLEAPLLILPSLQVNIRAGAMPPPSAEGKTFLRLPVNAI